MQYQIHLASKVDIPAVLDDKGKEKTKARTGVPVPGMSNRAVRYRLLDVDQIEAIALEAATIAGEEATGRAIFSLARKHSLYAMVTAYSPPTDDPLKLEEKQWVKTTAAMFLVPGEWSKVFTPKDTRALLFEYSKWHESTEEHLEVMSGKAIPVASGG